MAPWSNCCWAIPEVMITVVMVIAVVVVVGNLCRTAHPQPSHPPPTMTRSCRCHRHRHRHRTNSDTMWGLGHTNEPVPVWLDSSSMEVVAWLPRQFWRVDIVIGTRDHATKCSNIFNKMSLTLDRHLQLQNSHRCRDAHRFWCVVVWWLSTAYDHLLLYYYTTIRLLTVDEYSILRRLISYKSCGVERRSAEKKRVSIDTNHINSEELWLIHTERISLSPRQYRHHVEYKFYYSGWYESEWWWW